MMIDHAPWPRRALILMGLGALSGLLISLLLDGPGEAWTEDRLRLTASLFVGAAGALVAFTLERTRWRWSAAFALVGALVIAATFYWNGAPSGWSDSEGWRMASAIIAVVIAAPLFQTIRDEGAMRVPYEPVHAHAWTNAVLVVVGWAFILTAFLLTLLLSELFALVGITLLRDALQEDWFIWMLAGGAGGGVLGILRDRDRVLAQLQRVAMAVFAILAPILAVGLLLFVLALPFTGLAPLWEQTKSTTPILLSCVAGAIILANAVIDKDPDEERGSVLRTSAMILAVVILPLAIVAAISTGLRIGQYGFTPSRLWALTFVIVALLCAGGYLFAVVKGRRNWADLALPINVKLALFICGLALILAMPLVNFGAISTRDQLARLESGEVAPAKFDWAALRFDFGQSGERAVQRLAKSGSTAEIRKLAAEALASEDRYAVQAHEFARRQGSESPSTILVRPRNVPLPTALASKILSNPPRREDLCFGPGTCTLFWAEGATSAIVVHDPCKGKGSEKRHCAVQPVALTLENGAWRAANRDEIASGPKDPEQEQQRQRAAIERGEVEVRTVSKRQLFIGGEPVDPPFD